MGEKATSNRQRNIGAIGVFSKSVYATRKGDR